MRKPWVWFGPTFQLLRDFRMIMQKIREVRKVEKKILGKDVGWIRKFFFFHDSHYRNVDNQVGVQDLANLIM